MLTETAPTRITERTVKLFHKGERVACHLLGGARGRHTTVTEHMPGSHRYAGWTHERIRHEATIIGPGTTTLVDVILRSRPHPEQGFRACMGILRLARQYGVDRLEAACRRGLEIGARSQETAMSRSTPATWSFEINALRRVENGLANFLPPTHRDVLISMGLIAQYLVSA